MSKTIVAVNGTIGSGKDTVSEVFINDFGFYKTSFAAVLKDVVAVLFGWDRTLLEGSTEESRRWRDVEDPFWSERLERKITPRIVLQYFGTDILRTYMNTDIWVHCLENSIRTIEYDKIIISDCRFPNEIDLIRKYNGTMIEVQREVPYWYNIAKEFNQSRNDIYSTTPINIPPELKNIHISEWGWIGINNPDYVFYNTSTIEKIQNDVYLTFKSTF